MKSGALTCPLSGKACLKGEGFLKGPGSDQGLRAAFGKVEETQSRSVA